MSRLSQIIGTTSRDVYAIKHIPKQERVAAAHRATRDLHEWRRSLPPYLGPIRPSTLVPSFRRQATALRLAYSHAIIHANRPFLLGHMSDGAGASAAESVRECISAARVILETVDGMAGEGTLFHAFWWTPYVTFCALAVVYVREIQRNTSGEEPGDPSWAELANLADGCLSHLAKATPFNSPNRRYNVILEELRIEARNQRGRTNLSGPEHRVDNDQGEMATDGGLHQPLHETDHLNGASFAQTDDPALGMSSLLDGWQTSDWLDLDSSVCCSPWSASAEIRADRYRRLSRTSTLGALRRRGFRTSADRKDMLHVTRYIPAVNVCTKHGVTRTVEESTGGQKAFTNLGAGKCYLTTMAISELIY